MTFPCQVSFETGLLTRKFKLFRSVSLNLIISYHNVLWLSTTFWDFLKRIFWMKYVVVLLILVCYHNILWLSIINFKKYDKIIVQTYVRICSAQIAQIWFYWTFVLSKRYINIVLLVHVLGCRGGKN